MLLSVEFNTFPGKTVLKFRISGQRKKRAAPAPPIARLPSALSTQGLERIVDSEESLTSDIDLSKPSSDIGASSKANSDIGVHCKSSSDIGVSITTKQMKPPSSSKSTIKTEETNSRPTLKTSDKSEKEIQAPETLFKKDANLLKPVSKEPVVASANEPVVASAEVVKRGKLVYSSSSPENNQPSCSFISHNSFENMPEVDTREENEAGFIRSSVRRRSIFELEKCKLQSRIEQCRSRCRASRFPDSRSEPSTASQNRIGLVKPLLGSASYRYLKPKADEQLKKSQSFVNYNRVQKVKLDENSYASTTSLQNNPVLESHLDSIKDKPALKFHDRKLYRKQLVKIPTISHLDDIETHLKNLPECGILESRFNPKTSHTGSYICEESCRARRLKYSFSFQSSRLKDTKIVNSFEESENLISRSFSSRYRSDLKTCEFAPRLGAYNLTSCYDNPIISINENNFNFEEDFMDSMDGEVDLSPPPLSKLHFFAISTKPEDIQVRPMDSIPSDIDKLPSLPIINHVKVDVEKKLSILEPPPPGLVSREESNENWNQFLINLNSILENRVEEFV